MNTHQMRLGRLFDRRSHNGFVVAFDRGLGGNAFPAGRDALRIVEALTDSVADGVLLGPGLAELYRHCFAHRGAPSLLVRSDLLVLSGTFPHGLVGSAEEYRLLIEPSRAADLGADMIVLFLVLGYQDDRITADNSQILAKTVQQAHAVGLPVMVETVLWGSRARDQGDPDQLAFACRYSAELGADVVKTQYTGDVDTMRQVVDSAPVPVMALGGPSSDSIDALTEITRDVLRSGARGVVYGRNVWQSSDPGKTADVVAAVVHSETAGV